MVELKVDGRRDEGWMSVGVTVGEIMRGVAGQLTGFRINGSMVSPCSVQKTGGIFGATPDICPRFPALCEAWYTICSGV